MANKLYFEYELKQFKQTVRYISSDIKDYAKLWQVMPAEQALLNEIHRRFKHFTIGIYDRMVETRNVRWRYELDEIMRDFLCMKPIWYQGDYNSFHIDFFAFAQIICVEISRGNGIFARRVNEEEEHEKEIWEMNPEDLPF